MKLFPVTTQKQAEHLRSLPVLAIDLGFAFQSKSCGLSSHPKPLTFTEALRKTVEWVGDNSVSKEMVLILEAPLSSALSKGNPIPRGEFETHHNDGHLNRRHWHHNAGGAMSLAALYFLRKLSKDCAQIDASIFLVEGFVSRYETPKPTHSQVAKALEAAWRSRSRVFLPPKLGDGGISVLELMDSKSVSGAPLILRLRDGLSKLTIG
jgi:hypothetical protein